MWYRCLAALLLWACSQEGHVGLGGECNLSTDCQQGDVCLSGRCTPVACAVDPTSCLAAGDNTGPAGPTLMTMMMATGPTGPTGVISVPTEYSLTLDSTSASVSSFVGASVGVTVNRTQNAAGEVDFTVTGLPNGVTATLPSTTSNTSTLQLSAQPSPSAGDFMLTVSATLNGVTAQATLTMHLSKHVVVNLKLVNGTAISCVSPCTNTAVGINGVWQQPDVNGQVSTDVTTQLFDLVVLTFNGYPVGGPNTYLLKNVEGPTFDLIEGTDGPGGGGEWATEASTCNSAPGASGSVVMFDIGWAYPLSSAGSPPNCEVTAACAPYPDTTAYSGTMYKLDYSDAGAWSFGSVAVPAMTPNNCGDIVTPFTATLGVSSIASVSSAVAVSGFMPSGSYVYTDIEIGNAILHNNYGPGPGYSLSGPNAPGSATTRAYGTGYDGSGNSAWRSTRVTTSGPMTLITSAGPALLTPANAAAGVTERSTFSWGSAGPGMLYLMSATIPNGGGGKSSFYCYTANNSCIFPDLSAYPGWQAPTGGFSGSWSLAGVAPGSTDQIDTGQLVLQGSLYPRTSATSDLSGFQTASQSFTTP